MFLEADFYPQQKDGLKRALDCTQYKGDIILYLMMFHAQFSGMEMKINNQNLIQLRSELGKGNEDVADFTLAYQYFLKIFGQIIVNINYNMENLDCKEKIDDFILGHFNGKFPLLKNRL